MRNNFIIDTSVFIIGSKRASLFVISAALCTHLIHPAFIIV